MNAQTIVCRTMVIALLAAILCLLPLPVSAQEPLTVSGEVLDLSCYLSKGSKGPRHRTCAKLCAEKGLPIGVLTEAGEVYLLIEDHDNPEPYEALKKLAGANAEISGKKFERSGMQSILVQESKGL